jgi:bifunctional DNA-binding transcriptional regulator/antitoxin component of YhaV-PrlF toxin-antitoxin module
MQVVPQSDSKTIQEFESSMSAKGQVTIPLALRQKLAVKPKDKIVFRVEGDVVQLVPSRMRLADVYMSVPALKTPKTLAQMRDIIQTERAEAEAAQRS